MLKITDIQRQKNNQNKFSIFVNDEYRFSLYYEDLVHYRIKIGDSISDSLYNEIYKHGALSKAKQKALSFLSYKMRTEQEIKKKLADEDFSDNIINDVIDFLKKYNYVNDTYFAECYIKEKSRLKMHGKYKLRFDLKSRGISDDLYSDILDSVDYNKTAYELVCKRLRKKFHIDEKIKASTLNYLIRKGYTYDEAKGALEKYFEDTVN